MNNSHAAALAAVVILNWLIAHLATSWAMPPEVQSAFQTLIAIYLAYRFAKFAGSGDADPDPTPPAPPAPKP